MTISISQILTSVTEWIRHSSLIRNYLPLLLAWLSTGGFITFAVCAFAINGIARKAAGSRNFSGPSDQIYMVKTQRAP